MTIRFDIPLPDISNLVQGNTDTHCVWEFNSDAEGPSVMVTALIHGNELCGAWALKELLEHGVRLTKGRLILAFCNLAAFDSFNAESHDASRFVEEDMNRVWQLDKLNNPSTQERQRAKELVKWVKGADYLLDIHSMHEPSVPLLMTGMLERNVDLAKRLGTPRHVIMDAGHKDGTRMRDFGPFGDTHGTAQALLIECGFHGDLSSMTVARELVGRFLVESEVIEEQELPSDWVLPAKESQIVLKVTDAVVATSMNLTFAEAYQGMECIAKAGTVIAQDNGTPIVTPYDNCYLVMPSLRQLKPGVTVVRFAKEHHRKD